MRWISLLLGAAVLVVPGLVRARDAERPSSGRARVDAVAQAPIGPSQDTFIYVGLDSAIGHLSELRAGWNIVNFWTFLQFEIPDNLGPDARVTRARLEFYCQSSDLERANGNALFFNQANRSWNESSLTWRSKPSQTGPEFQWDPGACDVPTGAEGVWKVLTSEQEPKLLDVLNGWYTGDLENNGFIISSREGARQVFTFAGQGNNAPPVLLGKQPRLYMTFESGATPTFTPSITPTVTDTPVPSETPIPTDTPTPTDTPLPTDTPTATATPTDTPPPTDTPEPEGIYLPIAVSQAEVSPVETPMPAAR